MAHLQTALRPGRIQGMVVKASVNGDTVTEVAFETKMWSQIGGTTW
jgi:hypothetical protein